MDWNCCSCRGFEMGMEGIKRKVKEEAVGDENYQQQPEEPQNAGKPTSGGADNKITSYFREWKSCSSGRFEMGREALKREVKEEAVEEENYKQVQEQPKITDQPTSNADFGKTIHQAFASGGKLMHPSLSFEMTTRKDSRKTMRKTQKLWMFATFEVPSVMDRLEVINAKLDPQYPGFARIMLRSHVSWGFSVNLPAAFGRMYMPRDDKVCILEDEDGVEYETKFLAGNMRFSGGWKAFVNAHKLLEGDGVIFQLIGTCKFKVVIVRAARLGEMDGALGLLPLDKTMNEIESGEEVSKEKDLRATSFVDFDKFNIIVNGIVLDSQISQSIKRKYYDLCCAQNSYLHDGLINTITSLSAAEIISDTVKIADAIRSVNMSTPRSDFAMWDKTLALHQTVGFEVGFLRARLRKLFDLAVQLEDRPCTKHYKKAKLEHHLAEEEVKTLAARLMEAQQKMARYNRDILLLNKYVERNESIFVGEANAPW